MGALSDQEVVELGGWHSRCALVLATAAAADVGIALVDTNGDGRCIEFQQFWRDDTGRWRPGISHGPEPDISTFESTGVLPGALYAYGRTAPGRAISVHLGGREVTVRASEAGWWAAVVPPQGWPDTLTHSPTLLEEAQWAQRALSRELGQTVAQVVPPVFEAYGRLLRPVRGLRWSDIAAAAGKTLTATTRWEDLRPADGGEPLDGYLPQREAAALADVLAGFTDTPQECVYLVWDGYLRGNLTPADLIFEGNGHVILAGAVEAAATLHDGRVSATAWWPIDRSWFVRSDLDGYSSYLGCSRQALTALVTDPRLEVLPIRAGEQVDTSPLPPSHGS